MNDGLSDQAVAFSEPVHRSEGGELTVRDRAFVFEAHSGDGWQPGELTPWPGHRVLDDRGSEVLSICSGTLKPTFEFQLADDLDDHIAFPLLALATALAMRLRATGRRARGMSPYV